MKSNECSRLNAVFAHTAFQITQVCILSSTRKLPGWACTSERPTDVLNIIQSVRMTSVDSTKPFLPFHHSLLWDFFNDTVNQEAHSAIHMAVQEGAERDPRKTSSSSTMLRSKGLTHDALFRQLLRCPSKKKPPNSKEHCANVATARETSLLHPVVMVMGPTQTSRQPPLAPLCYQAAPQPLQQRCYTNKEREASDQGSCQQTSR